MSRFYEPTKLEDNLDLHDQVSDMTREILKLVAIVGPTTTMKILIRTLTCVTAYLKQAATGKQPSPKVADERDEFMEIVMEVFDEQAEWSEESQIIVATRGSGAINN